MFAAVAFCQSAVWLAEVADEVVALLGAAGAVLAIDQDLLGGTVLAWGETLPDLFAMLAVARAGGSLRPPCPAVPPPQCLHPSAREAKLPLGRWALVVSGIQALPAVEEHRQ